ncbi:MAG TPA: carboxy terminal-processing peptidase [Myxococcota bacterium]
MRTHHRLRSILRPLLVALALLAGAAPAAAQLQCEIVPRWMHEYLRYHVSQNELTPELERRAIETYVLRIDPSRSLLLESEAAEARAALTGIFERMQDGDCAQLSALHEEMIQHHVEMENAVRAFVSDEGYAIDEGAELVLDPDKRGYPNTPEARRALVHGLVHFQMSNYLSAGESLEEAKRLLIHRYELRTKRFAELDANDLYAGFLDSFASALDPHSNYYTAEFLEDFRISMSLSLEGIGVALSERDGYSVVEQIIPGGAAAQLGDAGLRESDKIIAVAEEGGEPVNIIDMPLRDAVSLIRGSKGTTVHLTVLRNTERLRISIIRDKIDLEEQAAKLRFETREVDGKSYKLAIIDLPSFYGDTDPSRRQCTDDVEKLLERVLAEGADGLLLDLSRNGGGLLEHAVTISGFFIRKGEVVGVEDARGQLSILRDRDERILYSGPLVVHTSRVSASASEILVGALKDYKRAVITGDDHTFGKGTVQTVTQLPPGQGALKITTALFFRPGGQSTQNEGVTVDVAIPSMLTIEDFGERTQRYALPSERISPFLTSYANAIGPEDRASRVGATAIAELAKRSKERVDGSESFAEVQRKIAEARAKDGVVRLADMLKEREEAETIAQADGEGAPVAPVAGASDEPSAAAGHAAAYAAGEADETLSPQVEEALNVLKDLVAALSRHDV